MLSYGVEQCSTEARFGRSRITNYFRPWVGLKNGLGALLQQTNSSLPPRVWYNSKGIDALFQKI